MIVGGEGSPSDHFMPLRSLKVKTLPSGETSHLSACWVHASRPSDPNADQVLVGQATGQYAHRRRGRRQRRQVPPYLPTLFDRLDTPGALGQALLHGGQLAVLDQLRQHGRFCTCCRRLGGPVGPGDLVAARRAVGWSSSPRPAATAAGPRWWHCRPGAAVGQAWSASQAARSPRSRARRHNCAPQLMYRARLHRFMPPLNIAVCVWVYNDMILTVLWLYPFASPP